MSNTSIIEHARDAKKKEIPFAVSEKINGALPASMAELLKKMTPATKCQK